MLLCSSICSILRVLILLAFFAFRVILYLSNLEATIPTNKNVHSNIKAIAAKSTNMNIAVLSNFYTSSVGLIALISHSYVIISSKIFDAFYLHSIPSTKLKMGFYLNLSALFYLGNFAFYTLY